MWDRCLLYESPSFTHICERQRSPWKAVACLRNHVNGSVPKFRLTQASSDSFLVQLCAVPRFRTGDRSFVYNIIEFGFDWDGKLRVVQHIRLAPLATGGNAHKYDQ